MKIGKRIITTIVIFTLFLTMNITVSSENLLESSGPRGVERLSGTIDFDEIIELEDFVKDWLNSVIESENEPPLPGDIQLDLGSSLKIYSCAKDVFYAETNDKDRITNILANDKRYSWMYTLNHNEKGYEVRFAKGLTSQDRIDLGLESLQELLNKGILTKEDIEHLDSSESKWFVASVGVNESAIHYEQHIQKSLSDASLVKSVDRIFLIEGPLFIRQLMVITASENTFDYLFPAENIHPSSMIDGSDEQVSFVTASGKEGYGAVYYFDKIVQATIASERKYIEQAEKEGPLIGMGGVVLLSPDEYVDYSLKIPNDNNNTYLIVGGVLILGLGCFGVYIFSKKRKRITD